VRVEKGVVGGLRVEVLRVKARYTKSKRCVICFFWIFRVMFEWSRLRPDCRGYRVDV
jgi:hypothetical protein